MSLPPAGWYDDPIDPTMQRWWDGDAWTEHRRSGSLGAAGSTGGGVAARRGDMRDVGDMVSHAFSLIRLRLGGIIGVGVVAASAIAVAYGVFIVAAFGMAFEVNAGEFIESNTDAIVLLIFLFAVAGVLAVASFLATTTMLWDAATGRSRSWGAAFANGFRRLFPYLGWAIVGGLPMFGVLLLAAAVGSGLENDAFGLIFLLVFIPLMYWSLVLYFVPVMVIRETGENAVMASFQLVKGRWWRIFGRMLAWGLIMIGIGIGVGIMFSIVAAAAANDGGPLGVAVAVLVAAIGLTAFFLSYALQIAPIVSITYDLVGGSVRAGDQTADVA